jgi:hypothetical protein
MRKLFVLLASSALLVGAAGASSAATLNLTGSTMGVSIGALPPISIPQSPDPVAIFVSSGGGSFVEPAGIFASTVVLPPQLFTGVNLISSLNVTASNGTGSFTAAGGPGGGFGGPKALQGQARVGVLGGALNLDIPLSVVGVGGQTAAGAFALQVTVTGHQWTTGAAQVAGITTGGDDPTTDPYVNTVTLAGYDNRGADHAGTLQLVTPIRILTNAAGNLPGFGIQTLTFVPEPGTLLLIGSGIAGLAIVGRKKLRK